MHLVPVDVDDGEEAPSWAWMARIDDASASAEVILADGWLMIAAPTEAVVGACHEFIATLAGTAATHVETFRANVPPGGFDRHGGHVSTGARYPHHTANIQHYLDLGDLSIRLAERTRTLGMYLGRIASATSRRGPGDQYYTGVVCRRRPGNRSCGMEIVAGRTTDGRIDWQCVGCGDSGTITGWERTAFDARDRDEILSRQSDPRTETRVMILIPKDVRRLRTLKHLDAPALRFLASAQETTDGKRQLAGTRPEMLALARCIAFHFARAVNISASSEDALHDLHNGMARFADAIPDLSQAAQCAEVLLFERSRSRFPRPISRADAGSVRLHVQLRDIDPPIWRQLELPGDFTLADLADVLILSFGWASTHLHAFEQDGRKFGLPNPDWPEQITDERSVQLSDLLANRGARIVWEYDFGDSWHHEIVAEELSTGTPCAPRLLAGHRAAPPEDCGGPSGYETLLEALGDPLHEDHQHLSEWSDDFDPEDFLLEKFAERVARMTEHASPQAPDPAPTTIH
ncbi:MAG: hypothetical protein ACI8Y8_003924 [Planctomycetota bacterium]|jgi:hypothetical protein